MNFIFILITKLVIIALISTPLTVLASHFYPLSNQEVLINIYNAFLSIIGVLYSISIGIILSFSFNKIKNKSLTEKYMKKITEVKDRFTAYFILAITNEIFSLFSYKKIYDPYKLTINMGVFGLINFILIVTMILANYNSLYKSKLEFDTDF